MLDRIISGGQDGADVAALRAARRLGIPTGGWMPAGFRTARGPRPDYEALYGVRCTAGEDYVTRTALNVQEADATVRFAWDWRSRGELATLREIRRHGKPYLDISIDRESVPGVSIPFISCDLTPTELRYWLGTNHVRVLNVAGNASCWIEHEVEEFLVAALGPQVSSPV